MKKRTIGQDWRFVKDSNVEEYQCGLCAGDLVRLRKDIAVVDHNRRPTGVVYKAGEVWIVTQGFAEEPGVVWLRQHDGEPHTWNDSPSIWEQFEKVSESKDTTVLREQIAINTRQYYAGRD